MSIPVDEVSVLQADKDELQRRVDECGVEIDRLRLLVLDFLRIANKMINPSVSIHASHMRGDRVPRSRRRVAG